MKNHPYEAHICSMVGSNATITRRDAAPIEGKIIEPEEDGFHIACCHNLGRTERTFIAYDDVRGVMTEHLT